jgi:hypothetical protein
MDDDVDCKVAMGGSVAQWRLRVCAEVPDAWGDVLDGRRARQDADEVDGLPDAL